MSDEQGAAAFVPLTEAQIQAANVGGVTPLDQPIQIADYDPEWPRQFEREAARLRAILGERVLLLEHVGSTSVPQLAAKPKIDLLLVVADSGDEPAYIPALQAHDYRLQVREPEWYQHRMLKGPDTDINLHVFSPGCEEVDRMLRFRDWLRSNTADRELYERTKRELARRDWKYMQNYADAKSAVVRAIVGRAVAAASLLAREQGETSAGPGGWPGDFRDQLIGGACVLCAEGRPDQADGRLRFYSSTHADAYLNLRGVQRGYVVVIWRGRHVVEPTQLSHDEAAMFWFDVLRVGKAMEAVYRPLKMNYQLLGNRIAHLHWTLAPRFADDLAPGDPLPGAGYHMFAEDEVRAEAELLRAALTQAD